MTRLFIFSNKMLKKVIAVFPHVLRGNGVHVERAGLSLSTNWASRFSVLRWSVKDGGCKGKAGWLIVSPEC